MGHYMNLRALADGLARRGHQVIAVLRDLAPARTFFTDPSILFLQAPFLHERAGGIEPVCTFAQILYSGGFGKLSELAIFADAWRRLFEKFEPDLIVFDHSPTALLAARGLPVRRALIGTGFFSPPDVSPLPNLRIWLMPDNNVLIRHEHEVLENINAVLARWNQPPLERVSQLYRQVDQDFLLTFRELDCYAEHRRDAHASDIPSQATGLTSQSLAPSPQPPAPEYWGVWTSGLGRSPEWPPGPGPKIFAYLKPFKALPQLLDRLLGLLNPILIYAPEIDPRMRSHFQCPNLRFLDEAADMKQVARECGLAILNGTHATTVAMLLAGKPALHIPVFLEQAINARAVESVGAGICAQPADPAQIINGLESMLGSDRFAQAAQAFAARYAEYDPDAQIERMVNCAEKLATLKGAELWPADPR